MPDRSPPRVALLGFSIECNNFAPVATRAHFLAAPISKAILSSPRRAFRRRRMLGETPGFVANMDAAGPWTPVGIACADAEPNGPVDHDFFTELMDDISASAQRSAAGRRGLYLRARRRDHHRGRRPGRRPVRNRAPRSSARTCRSPRRSTSTPTSPSGWCPRSMLYRLPHQPAHGHARARRGSRGRNPRNAPTGR